MTTHDRREFLKLMFAGAAAAVVPPGAPAQAAIGWLDEVKMFPIVRRWMITDVFAGKRDGRFCGIAKLQEVCADRAVAVDRVIRAGEIESADVKTNSDVINTMHHGFMIVRRESIATIGATRIIGELAPGQIVEFAP